MLIRCFFLGSACFSCYGFPWDSIFRPLTRLSKRAYALEKRDPNVGRELSGICVALGKGEEAVRISREVMDRDPRNAGLISNHALALLIAGNIQEAEVAVESALRLEPENQITRDLAKFIAAVRAIKRLGRTDIRENVSQPPKSR